MIDLRPIGYIVGLIVAVMGAIMLVPLAIELALGGTAGRGFLQSAALAGFCGGLTALACANRRGQGLDLQQTFVLTNAIWAVAVLVGGFAVFAGGRWYVIYRCHFRSDLGVDHDRGQRFGGVGWAVKGPADLARDFAMVGWLGYFDLGHDFFARDESRGYAVFQN